jgi:ABC-type amino acid transport substrate-binding protein
MVEPAPVLDAQLNPLGNDQLAQSRLEIILQRGTLRVGYSSDHLPYAFRNNKGNIIGFDLDLVHQLARDIKVSLEIHNVDQADADTLLNNGSLDMLVGGLAIVPDRALHVSFTDSHFYHTLGIVVEDANRDSFATLESILKMPNLTLALPGTDYYREPIRTLLGNPEIVNIDSPRDFFRGNSPDADAMVYPVEVASAWTLLYPSYSVVVPKGITFRIPAGLALPLNEAGLIQFMNTWLVLKEGNGFREDLYNYWILGVNPKGVKPRWSVMKDVLHWVE